ncbi:MAG: outer membrane lipoprotein-sorting protein [Rhodothermia bacterium]|nr:MAG: outer membrane lipoprotein-sorting protein [Rhodothermia bacterium]
MDNRFIRLTPSNILFVFVLFFGHWTTDESSAQPTAEEILRRVDENMTIRTARTRAVMTITYRGGDVRELEFNSWGIGTEKSFLEFVSPARDAGSRFLRLDDNMWIFLPRAGKSVRIQGHMLRQGLMGSDFSYGDASENPSMSEDYDAVLERSDTLSGRPSLVLYLTAKRKDVSYPSRRIWVDSEKWVPLKEERFARSGKLLKTALMSDIREIGGRWYPFRIDLNNALQSETKTSLQFLELDFNADVPDYIFTIRHLESGT